MKAKKEYPDNKAQKKASLKRLALVALTIALAGYITNSLYFRLDLTAEKRHTLSKKTKSAFGSIDSTLQIEVYLAGDELPAGFKRLKKAVNELMTELDRESGGNIDYFFTNPTESDVKQERFALYKKLFAHGVKPIEIDIKGKAGEQSNVLVFPAAIIRYKGEEAGFSFLQKTPYQQGDEQNINESVQALEYEFTNAFYKLNRLQPYKIAFLQGQGELPETELQGAIRVLSEYYNVQVGKAGGQPELLAPFRAVIIAKPTKAFSEADKFALDQYIMNGGRVLWMLDGAEGNLDSLARYGETLAMGNTFNLEDQLFNYGLRVNPDFVKDMQCAPIGLISQGMDGQKQVRNFPWPYFPLLVSHNNHSINKYLDAIRTEFLSTVDTVGKQTEVKKTILLYSSKRSKSHAVPVHITFDEVNTPLNPKAFTQGDLPVAVLAEGIFNSAYKNRAIPQGASIQTAISLKSKPTKMIMVADGDLIRNQVAENGDPYPLGFDRYTKRTFTGNAGFILNAVNYLCDDDGIMELRNRELKLRLLDKPKSQGQRQKWQLINIAVPMCAMLLFAAAWAYVRKRKYAQNQDDKPTHD